MFRQDFAAQCGKWREDGDRLIITMDANEHTMDGKLRGMLEAEGVGLVEFSHKSWGSVPPHTYIDGKIPIDASYCSPDVEITNFCMLPFISSPGDHRAFIIEATTRSLTGEHLLKISRPAGRRLVMSQPRAVNRYNQIVEEQFKIHRIEERMNAIDNLTRICGRPGPLWLKAMIIKLYKQMDEIRIHAEKKCRKLLTPASDFSP